MDTLHFTVLLVRKHAVRIEATSKYKLPKQQQQQQLVCAK